MLRDEAEDVGLNELADFISEELKHSYDSESVFRIQLFIERKLYQIYIFSEEMELYENFVYFLEDYSLYDFLAHGHSDKFTLVNGDKFEHSSVKFSNLAERIASVD